MNSPSPDPHPQANDQKAIAETYDNVFDVLIVGAGISGISAASYLAKHSPGVRFKVIEARSSLGGTWDLFRYPGIRSDSDMHTFGFDFKPWTDPKVLADGPAILAYLKDTVQEYGLAQHMQFNTRVDSANWNGDSDLWELRTRGTDGLNAATLRGRLLFMCSGYYRYDEGYTPDIPGLDSFAGQVVHPQHWPQDLDYRNKKVAVIGSGATAVTLIPAMADKASKITMVQRSPTYVVSRPGIDPVARLLNRFLPPRLAYGLLRWRNIRFQNFIYKRSRKNPQKMRDTFLHLVRKELGEDFDVETHFTPSYNPWDQRVCLVPDSDLFKAIKSGKADVVTGQIERITEQGILMESGELVEADLLVTATGLNMQFLGGVDFSIDGKPADFDRRFMYQGMMLSGVPNLIQTFGYVNASWTLRADLNSAFVSRLINKMKQEGLTRVTPELRPDEQDMPLREPFTEFNPGYMQRGLHSFPKQGDHQPWINTQDYLLDRKLIKHHSLNDGVLQYS